MLLDAPLINLSRHILSGGGCIEDPGHAGVPLGSHLEELDEMDMERKVWASLLRLLPCNLPPDKWMDGT